MASEGLETIVSNVPLDSSLLMGSHVSHVLQIPPPHLKLHTAVCILDHFTVLNGMVVFWSNHCYDLFTTTTMELNKIIEYLKILHECKSLLSFPPVNVTKLVLQY